MTQQLAEQGWLTNQAFVVKVKHLLSLPNKNRKAHMLCKHVYSLSVARAAASVNPSNMRPKIGLLGGVAFVPWVE
jgi:hypothetical protein